MTRVAKPKPKPKSAGIVRAIDTATDVLRAANVRDADDIHVARIAAAVGAQVVYVTLKAADGAAIQAGKRGLILIDEEWRGTFRARWTIAHELGHFLLHSDVDAIARIHGGGPQLRSDHRYEPEANAFAAQFIMPDFIFGERCCHAQPTIEHIRDLGDEFGASLQSAGRRYASLTRSACAFLEIDPDGTIYHPQRSTAFRGVAVKGRVVEEGTIAGAVLRGEAIQGAGRVEGGAWGSGKLGVEMMEHAEVVPESGVVVVWLSHADVPRRRRG